MAIHAMIMPSHVNDRNYLETKLHVRNIGHYIPLVD